MRQCKVCLPAGTGAPWRRHRPPHVACAVRGMRPHISSALAHSRTRPWSERDVRCKIVLGDQQHGVLDPRELHLLSVIFAPAFIDCRPDICIEWQATVQTKGDMVEDIHHLQGPQHLTRYHSRSLLATAGAAGCLTFELTCPRTSS